MSRDAIREKLGAMLRGAPCSEAEVVYVLVEVRKFLERGGKAQEEQYSTLKFFCDWILHVELCRTGARMALERLDAEIGASRGINPLEVGPSSELYRLMSLEPLREEIKRFCSENELPADWAINPTTWKECMRLYGHVVLDCPLTITGEKPSARYIKRLTLTNASDSQSHPDKRAFHWTWRFELSDGDSFDVPHEYSYPSPFYDPSRPTTARFGI